jgi:hypothetical protein
VFPGGRVQGRSAGGEIHMRIRVGHPGTILSGVNRR